MSGYRLKLFPASRLLRPILLSGLVVFLPPDAVANELPDIFSYRARDMETLRQGFAQPPREAGPWVHWFWWNGVLDREEISRELEELATAGFAGAELRCITFHGWSGEPLTNMDADSIARLGHQQVPYLSDEFIDLLVHTCERAESLGLRLAINMGQGWPPGGPWIPDKHRTKHLSWTSEVVVGPKLFSRTDLPDDGFAFAWKLTDDDTGQPTVLQDSFTDLLPHLHRENGKVQLSWRAPKGRWLIGLFRVTPGGICDKGDGPEVDPASRDAVQFHLEHFFGPLDPKLSRFYGTVLVDAASDSWEYHRGGKRYWSPTILESFPRLAGYDLRTRMHALLGYGPDIQRVHDDLDQVERSLVRDNFFATVAEFLHQRGLRHRPQVYGRGLARDFLDTYALADTPEVEHGIVLPEAPWAAHLTGKPVVSVEAFTFLSTKFEPVRYRNGLWEATPALLRWHANHFFAQGINRIQFHSFSYSPPQLPLPGWRMYAEIHFNCNLPWWWSLPELTGWMARNQWLLQSGHPMADTLVYPVRSNPLEEPYNQAFDDQPVSAANAIDGANRQMLLPLVERTEAGKYEFNNFLVLSDLRSSQELDSVLKLVESRGNLICLSPPEQWTALEKDRGEQLQAGLRRLRDSNRLVQVNSTDWRDALRQHASVRWEPARGQLTFLHRRVGQGHVYFLANYGDQFAGSVSFPHTGQLVEVWNADNGRVTPAGHFSEHDGRTELPISLGHFESTAVSFSPGENPVHVVDASAGRYGRAEDGSLRGWFSTAGEYRATLSEGSVHRGDIVLPESVSVPGPWQLRARPELAISRPVDTDGISLVGLTSWRNLPPLGDFAGTVSYRTTFSMSRDRLRKEYSWQLELGDVFDVARVWVNQQLAGTAWSPPFQLDVTQFLQAGENTIRVDVANLLKNHLEGAEYRRPSGLLGPVRLVPSRSVVLPESEQIGTGG